jgi:tripartite-type tricarboxylate transporter receptor subunit TctC
MFQNTNRRGLRSNWAFRAGLALSFVPAWFFACLAQDYPKRPVRLVAATTPGGGPDVMARLTAQYLGPRLRQQVIVDNRPGAGGNLGAEQVARAPADGYTLLLCTASQSISATLYRKLNYDLVRDFSAVSFIASAPQILVIHPSLPVKTLRELITLAKKRPGQLLFASGGVGTAPHLAGEMLKAAGAVDFVHVPYKGISAAVTDLLGGHIQFLFAMTPVGLPLVAAGKLRGIAITSLHRSQLAPSLPTMAETLPGFEAIGWYGVLGPAKTPSEIIQKLNEEIQAILNMPEVKKSLTDQGTESVSSTPSSFAGFIQKDIAKWGDAIRRANAQQD